jgi:threonyl-tRNA synthetase
MCSAEDSLYNVRHSLSHILAMAVLEVFPDAKLAIGPPIEYGFYYDFDLPRSLSPDDLPDLIARMRVIAAKKLTFERSEYTIADALPMVAGQPYKEELIRDLATAGETSVSFYTSGTFSDLCKGPHVASTGEIALDAFTLTHVAGAYWRGDEKRPMLQRIYGLAFATKEDLDTHIAMLEAAKLRDHRKLGPELGIFTLDEAVGSGFPLWLPNGATVKHLLEEYMRRKEEARGYQYVSTPAIASRSLYERSGHAAYYSDDMFSFNDSEGNQFFIKPMNCPHHHIIYERLVESYRDLPLRLAEAGGIYRHERSGTLTGLIRVRGTITQNDAHLYVTPDQLQAEFMNVLSLFKEVYDEIGIGEYWFRLSLPDFSGGKEKFGGDRARWDQAANDIRAALQAFGAQYVEAEGEAAFYGPKLDVQVRNVTGKEDTIATCQVDILVPGRMGLEYTAADGSKQTPIVIHRAILGSYERFTAFLIEQTSGNFPFWLAPKQVAILPVSADYVAAAESLQQRLEEAGIRVRVDASNESVGKKVRAAKMQKVPLLLVVGEREAATADSGWMLTPTWRADITESGEAVSLEALLGIMDSMQARYLK